MNKDAEIKKINKCISELVYEKTQLKKAYNYYHGERDADQFKYLENNYGIAVQFEGDGHMMLDMF